MVIKDHYNEVIESQRFMKLVAKLELILTSC